MHQCGLRGTAPMNTVNNTAIITARTVSSRYPGMPLIEIEGLPMIEHVRRRTLNL